MSIGPKFGESDSKMWRKAFHWRKHKSNSFNNDLFATAVLWSLAELLLFVLLASLFVSSLIESMSKRKTGSRANGAKRGELERDGGSEKVDEKDILSLGAIHIYKLNVKNNRHIADIIYEPNDDINSKSSSSKFDWCCCCRFVAALVLFIYIASGWNVIRLFHHSSYHWLFEVRFYLVCKTRIMNAWERRWYRNSYFLKDF